MGMFDNINVDIDCPECGEAIMPDHASIMYDGELVAANRVSELNAPC